MVEKQLHDERQKVLSRNELPLRLFDEVEEEQVSPISLLTATAALSVFSIVVMAQSGHHMLLEVPEERGLDGKEGTHQRKKRCEC